MGATSLSAGPPSSWLAAPHHLAVAPDASHLFTEAGALEQVGTLAREWSGQHLPLLTSR